MWETIPFPGQRVILNPSMSNYEEYKSQSNNSAGYIITILPSNAYINWATMDDRKRKDYDIRVEWDYGKNYSYKMKDLLCVDAPFKEFVYARIVGRSRIIYEKEMIDEYLDKAIIQEGRTLIEKYDLDDVWRARAESGINKKRSYAKRDAPTVEAPTTDVEQVLPFNEDTETQHMRQEVDRNEEARNDTAQERPAWQDLTYGEAPTEDTQQVRTFEEAVENVQREPTFQDAMRMLLEDD